MTEQNNNLLSIKEEPELKMDPSKKPATTRKDAPDTRIAISLNRSVETPTEQGCFTRKERKDVSKQKNICQICKGVLDLKMVSESCGHAYCGHCILVYIMYHNKRFFLDDFHPILRVACPVCISMISRLEMNFTEQELKEKDHNKVKKLSKIKNVVECYNRNEWLGSVTSFVAYFTISFLILSEVLRKLITCSEFKSQSCCLWLSINMLVFMLAPMATIPIQKKVLRCNVWTNLFLLMYCFLATLYINVQLRLL